MEKDNNETQQNDTEETTNETVVENATTESLDSQTQTLMAEWAEFKVKNNDATLQDFYLYLASKVKEDSQSE